MVEAARGLVPIYVDCSDAAAERELQARYEVQGYPTVLFLDPDGAVLEELASRQPDRVRAQVARIAERHAGTRAPAPVAPAAPAPPAPDDRRRFEAMEAGWRDLLRQRRYDEALARVDAYIAEHGAGARAGRLKQMRDTTIGFGAKATPPPEGPAPGSSLPPWVAAWGPTALCLVLALALAAWGLRRPRFPPLPAADAPADGAGGPGGAPTHLLWGARADPEELRVAVQARVEAGTDPRLAVGELQQRGVHEAQAREWVGAALRRRDRRFRAYGLADLLVGGVMVAAGVGLGMTMVDRVRPQAAPSVGSGSRRVGAILGLPILLAIGGALTVGRGLSRVAWGGTRERW